MTEHDFNGFSEPEEFPITPDDHARHMLDGVTDELAYKYDSLYSREQVRRVVESAYQMHATRATVRRHIPLLTQRYAEEQLLVAAQASGRLAKATPEVLFVCVHNAGRSQMAAAYMESLSGGRVHVRSAGSRPGEGVSLVATEAMAEVGIELTTAYPKPLTNDVVRAADVVVTMGCGDDCPFYPGKTYLDWDLPDPAGLPLEQVRPIRDAIRVHVEELLATLLPDLTPASSGEAS